MQLEDQCLTVTLCVDLRESVNLPFMGHSIGTPAAVHEGTCFPVFVSTSSQTPPSLLIRRMTDGILEFA